VARVHVDTGDVVWKTMLLLLLIRAKMGGGSFVDVFCYWWSGGCVSPHTGSAFEFVTSIFFFVVVVAVIVFALVLVLVLVLVLILVVCCWRLLPVVIRVCFPTGVVIDPRDGVDVYLLGLDNENEDVDDVSVGGGGCWRQAVAACSSPREALLHSTVALWPLLAEDRPFYLFSFVL